MGRNALGWGAILTVLAITVLASSPYSAILSAGTDHLPGGDKTGHVLIMGALAALCVLAFAGRRLRGRTLRATTILAIVGLAVTVDEFVQAAVPSRTFDWADLGASLVGVLIIGGGAALSMRRPSVGSTSSVPRS